MYLADMIYCNLDLLQELLIRSVNSVMKFKIQAAGLSRWAWVCSLAVVYAYASLCEPVWRGAPQESRRMGSILAEVQYYDSNMERSLVPAPVLAQPRWQPERRDEPYFMEGVFLDTNISSFPGVSGLFVFDASEDGR